ncbi:MAG: cytidylate kinase family protein, partial [Lentisphaerota bacterium]
MNHAEIVRRYLKNKKDVDIPSGGLPFVTISRQAGAGGHTLGRDIIRELDKLDDPHIRSDWEMFDQKLCAMIAQDKELPASFDALIAEEYHSGIQQSILEMLLGRTEQYDLQKKISEVVRLLATIGKVVIIGRGGMCLTQGMPQGIRLRLIAPEPIRVKGMAA